MGVLFNRRCQRKVINPKLVNPYRDHDSEHEIIESIAFLLSVIDASLTGICYLKPIHNDSQKIIDFLCVFANSKAAEFDSGLKCQENCIAKHHQG
jgi:hypothetical protein